MESAMRYVESLSAVGLFVATIVLVWVTRQHVRHAAMLAAAADRLGAILESQGQALATATDLHTMVTALAARHTAQVPDRGPREFLEGIIADLIGRYRRPGQPGAPAPPTQS
jgi:hypothetical protein